MSLEAAVEAHIGPELMFTGVLADLKGGLNAKKSSFENVDAGNVGLRFSGRGFLGARR